MREQIYYRYNKNHQCFNNTAQTAIFFFKFSPQPVHRYRQNHYPKEQPNIRIQYFINSHNYSQTSRKIYTFISTSTPLGNSSFIRASTVFAVEL